MVNETLGGNDTPVSLLGVKNDTYDQLLKHDPPLKCVKFYLFLRLDKS